MKEQFEKRQREIVSAFQNLRAEREVILDKLRVINEEILMLKGEARFIKSRLGGDVRIPSSQVEIVKEEVAGQKAQPNLRGLGGEEG